MRLKQKFLLLAGTMGLLMAIVSVIGYYTASNDLRESVDSGLRSSVIAKANRLDGWLQGKKTFATANATYMTGLNGDMEKIKTKEAVGMTDMLPL